MSQGGGMLVEYHRVGQAGGIGVAYTGSIGNEAMLEAASFLEELLPRPEVRVLGALLEGIRNPERFLAVAGRALAAGKPLVVYKVGGGEVGTRSIAAHTGSLAGADAVVDAAFHRSGAVRGRSLEELVGTGGPKPGVGERRVGGLAEALRRAAIFSAVASSSAVDPSDYSRELMARHGLQLAAGLEMGVRTLHHAIGYGQARGRAAGRRALAPGEHREPPLLAAGRSGIVPELEAKRLLAEYGIRSPAER